jgi:hypothetical protein
MGRGFGGDDHEDATEGTMYSSFLGRALSLESRLRGETRGGQPAVDPDLALAANVGVFGGRDHVTG